jgi:hypothetical protein
MPTDDGAIRLLAVRGQLAEYGDAPQMVTDNQFVALRQAARAAIDRLDDEPEFDDAHETLDAVGRFVRQQRPGLCLFARDGDNFVQECPVALGHVRLGLSVAMEIEESHCSICEQDLWTCPHIPGQLYDGQSVVRVITRARVLEVSVVERPDFADARFMSRPVSRAGIEEALGGPLPVNARPICDRCLEQCSGVDTSPLRRE